MLLAHVDATSYCCQCICLILLSVSVFAAVTSIDTSGINMLEEAKKSVDRRGLQVTKFDLCVQISTARNS